MTSPVQKKPRTPKHKQRTSPSDETRWRLIVLHEEGYSQRQIADRLKITQSTVCKHIKRYKETGDVHDRPRTGRPRKTSTATDRYIQITSERDRFLTAPDIARILQDADIVDIHRSTVSRRLSFAGLDGRVARKKPLLSETNRVKRLVCQRTSRLERQRLGSCIMV